MNDSPFAVENAYAPPQVDPHGLCPFRTNPEAKEYGAVGESGWMYRRVCFYGAYQSVVEWNGSGAWEKVTIDGQVAKSIFNWGAHIVMPYFEFPVDAGYAATMTVEIRLRYLVLVDAFRIRLDGRTLYAEGRWPDDPFPAKPR